METKVRRLRHKYEPGQIGREVPVLFPQTEAECTPEEIAFYRRIKAEHGAFAFAIDRQSVRREALRKGATGMLRRVQNIHLEAEHLGIYLPAAAHLPDAPDGTLPFQFDENFWYVDGTAQQATGYAANQHARPRLWRAFLLAQALANHGCAPKAFLIGEATRFYRDEGWLTTFVRALWRRKVQIYVAGFGEVTKDALPGLVAYINALSGWLGKVNEAAREIKRRSGAIYHRNAPLMLMFSPDGQEVFAEPTYWPIMGRMLEALATGELTTATGAAAWLKQFGVERTYVWVCNFVHGSIPDGIYDKAYSSQ